MSQLSLERRLTRTLVAAILAGGILAAGGSFLVGYFEARGLQDDTLRQIASAASGDAGREIESQILSIHLPADPRPPWMPGKLGPGFHTIQSGGESMRVFVRILPNGEQIVTAQATELREDVATSSALHAFIPVLLLLPLLAWLTARVLAAERRALDQQRRFIADAAHELRSPLTALSLQAENVEKAATLDAARERVAALRSGIDRARHLTEQLLRMARSQARIEPPQVVDLVSLARELISESIGRALAKRIDLGLDERSRPQLRASREDLVLILNNALDNALRHTPVGGEVTIVVTEDGPDAVVEIQDSGPGIPEEHRAAVFVPFHRLEDSGEGSGLGLSIALDAAARLRGTITLADRAEGRGLVFRYRQRKA